MKVSCLFPLILPLFLSAVPAGIAYGSQKERSNTFLVVTLPTSANNYNPQVGRVINAAISTELGRIGFSAKSAEGDLLGKYPELTANFTLERDSIISLTEEYGAGSVIVCLYEKSGDSFILYFTCCSADTPSKADRKEIQCFFDLSFDQNVSCIVDELVKNTGIPVVQNSSFTETPAPIIKPQISPKEYFIPFPEKLLWLTFGAAPFIAVGKSNYYFSFGFFPLLKAAYHFPLGSGLLGIGIISGINHFFASGLLSSAKISLLPMGILLDYTTNPARKGLHFLFSLSGGPSLFSFVPDNKEILVKVIPYLSGGAGLSLSLSDSFGISFETEYFIFFEPIYPIMGFVPSLSCTVRI